MANTTKPIIDANALEAMAKERPDEKFLKGSGVLKLIQAIRDLERANRQLQAEQPTQIKDLRKALQFYSNGHHFVMHDETAWDTVSGEPINFYEDEAGTATVEDGSIAKLALAGHPIKFEDEDTPAQPAPAATPQADSQPAPIDMVLHCPKCGLQHIDAPEWTDDPHDIEQGQIQTWKNEPHRSHLCHGCGHIWRPADVPTNGVRAVKTIGKADSPIAARAPADSVTAPAGGNWIAADDVKRLVRELDVYLNGETGAAAQASLCDVVAQVRHEAAKRGQPLLAAPAATPQADSQPAPVLDRARIREIFMAHGFTVKEGQTDLKQYVYDAAAALLRAARAPADSAPAMGLQNLHNLLYLAQRQNSKAAMERVVSQARLELARMRDASPHAESVKAASTGELLMGLAVIRELTGTQKNDLESTVDAVRAAFATKPARAHSVTAPAGCEVAGWQMVPIKPTHDMLCALSGEWHPSRHQPERYAAMLAAAPTPPAQAADSVLEDAARRAAERPTAIPVPGGAELHFEPYVIGSPQTLWRLRRNGMHIRWLNEYEQGFVNAAIDAARKQGANHD